MWTHGWAPGAHSCGRRNGSRVNSKSVKLYSKTVKFFPHNEWSTSCRCVIDYPAQCSSFSYLKSMTFARLCTDVRTATLYGTLCWATEIELLYFVYSVLCSESLATQLWPSPFRHLSSNIWVISFQIFYYYLCHLLYFYICSRRPLKTWLIT